MSNFETATRTAQRLFDGVRTVIRGRDDTVRLVLCALFADGHALLEDYPGSGKTTLTKTLGRLISCEDAPQDRSYIAPFRRIQFTPDMLPGDVLGVNIFEPTRGSFHFVHGPVFAHIVLADELNRTGPKVQAAFLECMAEKQVTIENVTIPLDDLFFVLGTQNPLDIAGTYPLPLVQLDRFMLRIPMTYVDAETEQEILASHDQIMSAAHSSAPVCTRHDVLEARRAVKEITVSNEVRAAMVAITQATRRSPALQFGASTRAALMLQDAVRAWAMLNSRDYVTEDDVKYIAPFVLLHRLRFHPGAGDPVRALEDLMLPQLEHLVSNAARAVSR
ncbi:MAG: MoxR family ATPase [Bdellovibrionota bacterium]|nr:MAG: MoxR family ATPase [Bdellovibrionota bacterium]